MATLDIVTKESLDTQRTGYSLKASKMDGDAEGHVGQVPTFHVS